MATKEGGSHPFNWFVIGFVVGVAATLAVLMWLGMGRGAGPSEESQAQAQVVTPKPAPAQAVAPPPAVAAPPTVKKPVEPRDIYPSPSQRESDAQMAEDAAAAGMTSRTRPGQSTTQH